MTGVALSGRFGSPRRGSRSASAGGRVGWRLVRLLGWSLAALEILYLVGANVLLNFNLLPLAFAGTNQVKTTVRSGWSIIPGRVHLRGVRVIFQDHNLEFSIDIARAFTVVHLRELLHHVFHASHLRGDGLSFRMRQRIDPWSKNQPFVGALAPIVEFPAPAVFEAYVPEPPIPDAKYDLWTVHLDDVDVAVSELWVQAFAYRGLARARGEFELKPARRVWVGPASLELGPGSLSAGSYLIARGLHGRVKCSVDPFDARAVSGMAPFQYISAAIRLDSPTLDLQAYALFASEPAARVSSAGGEFHAEVEIRRGVLTDASRIDLAQREFELRLPEGELDAERIELHAETGGDPGSRATLLVDRAILREPIALGRPPMILHLSAAVHSENRNLTQDFAVKGARLNEARLLLVDSHFLNRWLAGPGFAFSGGGASVLARGSYEDARLEGDALIETHGVRATLGDTTLRYAGSVQVQLLHGDPEKHTGSLRISVNGGASASSDAPSDKFSLVAPELEFMTDSEPTADGELTRFRAVIPAFRAEGRGTRLTSAALARGTLAQSKNSPKRLEFSASLRRPRVLFGSSPGTIATAPALDMHGSLSRDALGVLNGRLQLAPASWQVDAANLRISGRSQLAVELSGLDLARHRGLIDAHLTSTGVTLGDTTENADCPWSRVQKLALDGQLRLLERDTSSVSVRGDFAETELSWGDFTTHANIALDARFEQGFLAQSGAGSLDLRLNHAHLQSGSGTKGWAAQVPTLDLKARLARRAGKLTATATLRADAARGRIGATPLSTDLLADFDLDALDLDARTAHGSGALHVRDAALPNAPEPVSKWWADVKADSIFGHAGESLELGSSFRADLRDATPGLAVLSAEGSLPQWVATAFPLRGLSVTGSLARRCRLTDIRLVNLSGGPATARGRLQSVPDGFQGALLFRLAGLQAISAGLNFNAEHTQFGMFAGDAWLAGFNRYFDHAANDAVTLACPADVNQCSKPETMSVAAQTPQ